MDLSPHRCLVETDWLAAHLDEPALRIVDCTSLLPNYFTDTADQGLELESGRDLWEAGHIPGSTYADLLDDLSDRDNGKVMYGVPSAERFAAVMSAIGIGNEHAVVLYDQGANMWAARLWWLLRNFGFNNAAVLNGGWTRWCAEGRPVSTAAPDYPPAKFEAHPVPDLIATREQVLAALDNDGVCLVNALDPDEFAGRPPQRYSRSGRIPGSVNVPFAVTAEPDTQNYTDDGGLESIFSEVGATSADKVICYCGGGIAACSTALALTRLGHQDVAVYDGSMTEWTADPALPLEQG